MLSFQRSQVSVLSSRLSEDDIWTMQFIVGPRQTGKTTIISQSIASIDAPCHFVTFPAPCGPVCSEDSDLCC